MLALFLVCVFCKQKYSRITYQFLLVLKKRLLKFKKQILLDLLLFIFVEIHKIFNFVVYKMIMLIQNGIITALLVNFKILTHGNIKKIKLTKPICFNNMESNIKKCRNLSKYDSNYIAGRKYKWRMSHIGSE